MFQVKCDQCGKIEEAREYKEASMKPMFVEPLEWLRRFDVKGRVIATLCCAACDRKYNKGLTIPSR